MDIGEKGAVRILIVEDNSGDVHLLEKALQARHIDYQLTRYEDGEEAMRAISGGLPFMPDLILLDLNLPRRSGFDVLGLVRNTPGLVGVPVGVFTSSNTSQDRSRAALIGAERYIHKPPTLQEFLDEVGGAVETLLSVGRA